MYTTVWIIFSNGIELSRTCSVTKMIRYLKNKQIKQLTIVEIDCITNKERSLDVNKWRETLCLN